MALCAAVIATAVSVQPVSADPVDFRLSNGQASEIITALYADELKTMTAPAVETALIDVQDDGIAEIAARFVSGDTCSGNMCETVIVLAGDDQQWHEVFRSMTKGIELKAGEKDFAEVAMEDAPATYAWNGSKYTLQATSFADAIELEEAIKGSPTYEAAKRDFREKFAIAGAANSSLLVQKGEIDINSDGSPETVVRMDSAVLCGTLTGCPVALYSDLSRQPLIKTSSSAAMFVTHRAYGPYKGLMVTSMRGHRVIGWNGQKFTTVDRYGGSGQ